MSLGVGTRIGPYEVTAPLGEGGMGVVFRARDTRLQRDVALKLLPEHLAFDADRLKRFEREAQLLASLNHPHIAHVYGLEAVASTGSGPATLQAIAMELVEGETLAERIEAHGPMAADEAVTIARQIVSALEAAHERGIVHRDLKPANIKLAADGTVKVLDFGLAKEVGTSGSTAALSNSPTVTGQSMPGVIIGTLAYMSPEQARGKTVDARADIWAFGCVLYEMLTGRRAFDGETATDIIAKVVSGEPSWDRLPKTTPANLRQLLRVALTRDVRERLQHIGDARLFLTSTVLDDSPTDHRPERHKWIPIAIGAVVLLGSIVPVALYFRREPMPAAPAIRFEIAAPGLFSPPSALGLLSISPNGRQIAYVSGGGGPIRIWLRPIDGTAARALPGTENASGLFWSTDSRYLGFFADGMLKKIDVQGGPAQSLAETPAVVPGTWNGDDVILFTRAIGTGRAGGIGRVAASGGPVTPVATEVKDANVFAIVQPRFLPDRRHFLYHVLVGRSASPELIAYVGSLDSPQSIRVASLGDSNTGVGNSPVLYVTPGYLLFLKGGTLIAQAFDADRLALTGAPRPLIEGVGAFSVSDTGVLVYTNPPPPSVGPAAATPQQLRWFDRSGKPIGQVGGVSSYLNPRLSHDGRRVAVQTVESGNTDIWLMDLSTGVRSRLTFDPAADGIPVWSPNDDRVVFASSRNSPIPIPGALYEKASSGAGEDRALMPGTLGELNIPQDWSPDGTHVVYGRLPVQRLQGAGDLWALPLVGDRKPFPVVQSATSRAGAARFSPDGRWLAYGTNETGTNQIVVRPFPEVTKGIWQVPGSGGVEATWRGDGKEMFYLGLDGTLMSVPVALAADRPEFGQPVPLFKTGLVIPANPTQFFFDVAPDGKRFLLNLPASTKTADTQAPLTPINVVVNWTSLLTK